MKQTENKSSYFQRFQSSVMNNMVPSSALERDSLTYWRVRILFVILFTGVSIGTFVLVPVIIFAIKEKMWGLVIFDGFVWLTGVSLLLSRSLGYNTRAGIGSLMLYLVGVVVIIFLGPLSGGPVWLFTFAIFVGIFFGSQAAIMALITNAITIMTIGCLIKAGVFGQAFPFFNNIEAMIAAVAIFILWNTICAMSVAVLIRGLVSANQKEKSLISNLEIEQSHLLETKNKLELEVEERKQAETALRESEELFRNLIERANDGIAIIQNYKLQYVNPRLPEILGYSVDGMSKAPFSKFISQDELPMLEDRYEKRIAGEQELSIYETSLLHKDGHKVPVELNAGIISFQDEPADLVFARDITERKQAETALRESEKLYRLLAENVTDIIWTMDMEMNFTYSSPSVTRLRGYSVEEAMAQSIEESMTPASFDTAMKTITEELEMHNKGQKPQDRSRTIAAELYCKDGSTIWTEIEANFIYDSNGQPEGVIGVARDITERRRTEQQLLRSKKLAALGDMVAGVAHEISTPLGVNLMAASYLNDTTHELNKLCRSGKVELSEFEKYAKKATEASSMILTNLERAVDLLNSFKNVAVDQIVEERRNFNLKTNIEDTLSSLRPKYKRTAHTVTVECQDNLMINSYPGAFSQIVTNLVMNSLTHGFEGIEKGEIIVRADKKENMLLFTYRDTGKGMDEATLNKLFDPFFTTTRSKGGIGLGMHIVYNLASKTLKGLIDCRSSLGKGVEFIIEIPLSDENQASPHLV